MMRFSRLQLLKRMEALKIAGKLNFVFTGVVMLLVTLQISFAVRVEMERVADYAAASIYGFAFKYIDNLALTFLPILLLVNVAKEFEYGVVQRTLISGFSRAEYYTAKLILVTSFAFCSVFLAMYYTMLTSLLHDISLTWDYNRLLRYFPATFYMASFSLLLALMLRKSIYALAAFIGYILLENILASVIQSDISFHVLPFQLCVQVLKNKISGWRELVLLATYNAFFLLAGYRRISKMGLQ